MFKTKSGFTIVELLIVIVVIGILAAITIVAYNGIQQRGRIAHANQQFSQLKTAMLAYKAVTGELPPLGDAWNYDTNPPSCSTPQAIIDAIEASGNGTGLSIRDPWGSCWGYDDNDCNSGSLPGSASGLQSAGPDKLMATGDEISLQISSGC